MAEIDQTDSASWAPRHAEALIGHEAAERVFLKDWAAGRLAHAWLITGPKGIGKASFAFRCARFVLQRENRAAAAARQGASAPGLFGDEPAAPALPDSLAVPADDPVFQRVASLGHADLLVIERAWDDKGKRWRSEIVAEDARRLVPFFGMTAAEGGHRIAIIDSADELNRHAANAILKILEEPPPKGLLFLVSHSPGRLLPTIRSRCRRLELQPLPPAQMAGLIAQQAPDLPDTDRDALAALAAGSPGRLEALLEGGGLALYDELLALLAPLPAVDVAALHAFADRLGRAGAGDTGGAGAFATLLDLLGGLLARLIAAAARGGRTGERVAAHVRPAEAALAARLFPPGADLAEWIAVWEKLGEMGRAADSLALDRKHVLLSLFNRLAAAAGQGARAA